MKVPKMDAKCVKDLYDFSHLKDLTLVEERYASLPTSISDLIDRAISGVSPSAIYAFGSRVRGDFAKHSDLDLAIDVPMENLDGWALFSTEEPERTETLLSIDLVALHECDEALSKQILKEGVLLYERE